MTKFFRPRDVGCNRYPIYDENGEYLRDGLKSGFEFDDFADLKQKLVELLGHKLYDHLYITEDGGVINGLCIGYVEQTKPPETSREQEMNQYYTDRNQCLLVNVFYGDVVNEFDKLLTDLRHSYVKAIYHSFAEGWFYKFIIINYKEQEAISSFLSHRKDVHTNQIITLTDEEVNVLISLFLK